MRVLHVTTEYPPIIYGGLGTAVGGLVAASARAGLDVAVLLVGAGASPAYESNATWVPEPARVAYESGPACIRPTTHADAVADAIAWARSWKPDLIHVHVFWLAHVAIAIRDATGIPLVYTVHSLDRAEYEIGQGPPECLSQWNIQSDLIHAADRVIALTEDERDLIVSYCAEARPRVRIVGNGIEDTERARKAARSCRKTGPVTVLYTGRFVERKGIRELLEAAPAVLDDVPGVRFVLAGGHRHCSGDDMARHWFPQCCAPFRDRIFFTGWLSPDELNHWYELADVLVVPSWYEPFGMVILEGMLYGLAIVAADVGGPRAILNDSVTGLLCRPRDASSLEASLRQVVADQDLRTRLGRNAAHWVRSHWLFDSVVQRMRGVYAEIALTH